MLNNKLLMTSHVHMASNDECLLKVFNNTPHYYNKKYYHTNLLPGHTQIPGGPQKMEVNF